MYAPEDRKHAILTELGKEYHWLPLKEFSMSGLGRVSTGLDSLDEILDGLRLGDNVVWQVDDLEDYRFFVSAWAERTARENRKINYLRFASHPPLLENQPQVVVYPYAEVLKVCEVEGKGLSLLADIVSRKVVCFH